MIVPTVLATTARRSCTRCCASDRPVAEDIAISVTSLCRALLADDADWALFRKPDAISRSRGQTRSPKPMRGQFGFCLPPADFLVCSGKQLRFFADVAA